MRAELEKPFLRNRLFGDVAPNVETQLDLLKSSEVVRRFLAESCEEHFLSTGGCLVLFGLVATVEA